MSNAALSPVLAAALALTAKHIEPMEPLVVPSLPPGAARATLTHVSQHSKKVRRNRKRNKLAAKSRRRNNR